MKLHHLPLMFACFMLLASGNAETLDGGAAMAATVHQDTAAVSAEDLAEIRTLEYRLTAALHDKDIEGVMAAYIPGPRLFVYHIGSDTPVTDRADERAYWGKAFSAANGPIDVAISGLAVTGDGHLAVGHHLQQFDINLGGSKQLNMLIRITTTYEKVDDHWYIAEEHDSLPISIVTGRAIFSPETSDAAPQPLPALDLPVIANGTGKLHLNAIAKPLFLNFFASWCPPCHAEAARIGKIADEYKERGVVTIGIDEAESDEAARGFIGKYALHFPLSIDSDGSVLSKFSKIGAIPCGVFVDRRGMVVAIVTGSLSADDVRRHLDEIAR
jgi:ketosteroid isomerase-like protein/peroxiredoxin